MKTYIKKIDNEWYAFGEFKLGQFCSIGKDCPRDGGIWVANCCDEGIKYVSSPSASRSGAYQKARRYGQYCGEW